MLLVIVGALIGGAVSLASSVLVRWWDRTRERRAEIYLDALPEAIAELGGRGIQFTFTSKLDRLHRLAMTASHFDATHTASMRLQLDRAWSAESAFSAVYNAAPLADQQRFRYPNVELPELDAASAERDEAVAAARNALDQQLRKYQTELGEKLRRRQPKATPQ